MRCSDSSAASRKCALKRGKAITPATDRMEERRKNNRLATANIRKLNRGVFQTIQTQKPQLPAELGAGRRPGAGRVPPHAGAHSGILRCAHTVPSCISGTPLAMLTPAAFSGNPHCLRGAQLVCPSLRQSGWRPVAQPFGGGVA